MDEAADEKSNVIKKKKTKHSEDQKKKKKIESGEYLSLTETLIKKVKDETLKLAAMEARQRVANRATTKSFILMIERERN